MTASSAPSFPPATSITDPNAESSTFTLTVVDLVNPSAFKFDVTFDSVTKTVNKEVALSAVSSPSEAVANPFRPSTAYKVLQQTHTSRCQPVLEEFYVGFVLFNLRHQMREFEQIILDRIGPSATTFWNELCTVLVYCQPEDVLFSDQFREG